MMAEKYNSNEVSVNQAELLRLLEKLAVPSHCKKDHSFKKVSDDKLNRLKIIEKELAGSGYKWVCGKRFYRLYAQDSLKNIRKRHNRILLISSHADTKCGLYDKQLHACLIR